MFTETEETAPEQQAALVPGGERALGRAAAAGAGAAEDRAQPRARLRSPVAPTGEHVRQQRGRSHHGRDNRGSLRRKRDLESSRFRPPDSRSILEDLLSPPDCTDLWDVRCQEGAVDSPIIPVFLI